MKSLCFITALAAILVITYSQSVLEPPLKYAVTSLGGGIGGIAIALYLRGRLP